VLQGCAVIEEWQDARGMRGQSLFYVEPTLRQWKQVWVTEAAQRVGGVKEKQLIASSPGGGVRFQGELEATEKENSPSASRPTAASIGRNLSTACAG
jgi:hypothetical protein